MLKNKEPISDSVPTVKIRAKKEIFNWAILLISALEPFAWAFFFFDNFQSLLYCVKTFLEDVNDLLCEKLRTERKNKSA